MTKKYIGIVFLLATIYLFSASATSLGDAQCGSRGGRLGGRIAGRVFRIATLPIRLVRKVIHRPAAGAEAEAEAAPAWSGNAPGALKMPVKE